MSKLFLLLLVGAGAWAQGPRRDVPWWDTPLAKNLNLSEDQSRQIKTAVREHRGKLIDMRAAVERAELEIEDMMSTESVDLRKAADATERLVKARGDLTREYTLLSFRLRAVLTPGQWKDLQRRLDNPPPTVRREQRGPDGGGEGPPQGPGPRPPQQRPRPQEDGNL